MSISNIDKTREEVEKIKKLADAMYYAAQYLTTDASRLHKAMDEYHKFIIHECKEEPVSDELEKVVEEIVDPTVLNAYGVKEIANRLRRTMIEPVSDDLEEAANNALNNVLNTHEIVNIRSCLEMFRFGANWKKEQLIKEAINGIARPDDGEVWCDLRPFNLKDGDKLKLIIIKED